MKYVVTKPLWHLWISLCLDIIAAVAITFHFSIVTHKQFTLFVTEPLLYIQDLSSTINVTDDASLFMSVSHRKEKKNLSVSFLLCFNFLLFWIAGQIDLCMVSLYREFLSPWHTDTQFTPWGENECLYVIQQPPRSVLALTRGTHNNPP